MPCSGQRNFSHITMTLVFFLTQMLVSLTWHVTLSILLFILVGAAACLFCACWVRVRLCTVCHSCQHTGVVHMSLQVDGNVAFEEIPLFGVCQPACHDSPVNIFVLKLYSRRNSLISVWFWKPRHFCIFRVLAMHHITTSSTKQMLSADDITENTLVNKDMYDDVGLKGQHFWRRGRSLKKFEISTFMDG